MKVLFIFALTSLFVFASTAYVFEYHAVNKIMDTFSEKPVKELFKIYHYVFNKEYNVNTEEGIRRYRTFKANLKEIKEHNAKNLSWTLGINQFTDISKEEFKTRYLMTEDAINEERKYFKSFNLDSYDDSNDDESVNNGSVRAGKFAEIDYRNYFTPARNQGDCGSCWAMTSASVLEANISKEHGIAPFNLSPQQMIDCNPYANGCFGGNGPAGFDYAKTGIVLESAYPYKGINRSCNKEVLNDPDVKKFRAKGYTSINSNSPTIENWYSVLSQGPMYTRIDGKHLHSYKGGIIRYSEVNKAKGGCNKPDHAVTVAGIGYENDNMYILVRNSWGQKWGEDGYFRAYYETAFESLQTCFMTYYGYRPIPEEKDGGR